MVFGDSGMIGGEVAPRLDSGGPFQGVLYSDSESNLPKVEVAGSIPVSRSKIPTLALAGFSQAKVSSVPAAGLW
jgi:hypothetical protein